MLFYQDLIKKSAAKKVKLEKLPAVFPILLYNGEDKWQPHAIPGSGCTRASGPSDTPVELKDLIEVRYEALGKYIPNFAYYKIIENEFSQESLKELKSINAALFRLEMSGEDDFGECALRLTRVLKREAKGELKRDFRMWLNMMLRTYGIDENEIDKIIDELDGRHRDSKFGKAEFQKPLSSDRRESDKVTNLESNIKKMKKESEEKGVEIGIEKGKLEVAIGLYEDGVNPEIILKRTGHTVKEIKEELKRQKTKLKQAA